MFHGLHLTRGTLSAVSKYPWVRFQSDTKKQKWGTYASELKMLDWSRDHLSASLQRDKRIVNGIPAKIVGELRTLEAQIMDWADDVAYAIHDLEDFYRVGAIPLDRVMSDELEQDKVLQTHFERRNGSAPEKQEEARVRLCSSPNWHHLMGRIQVHVITGPL